METIIASEVKIELKKGWSGAGKTSEDGDGKVPHTTMAMAELRQGQRASEGMWAEVDQLSLVFLCYLPLHWFFGW